MANFGINGFGRIGRNVLRAMSQDQVAQVRAINDLTDTHTLAHLLKWDSVHGKFDGEIGYDNENIIVRGHKIRVLKERDPAKLPWKDWGSRSCSNRPDFSPAAKRRNCTSLAGPRKC
jgi:glyceraldehyde 3-phosphate dehydrogenase